MNRDLRWHDYITLNLYWFGFAVESGSITPVLLPFLVALYVPSGLKNTYLANIRVTSLALAMLAQSVAGMLSDRCTHPLGRRRPYIIGGTALNLLFLLIIGLSPQFVDSTLAGGFLPGISMAYLVLLIGIVLVQVSSNVALGAVLGLIPDLVPEHRRGRASGVKSVLELLSGVTLIVVGPLVDGGQIWLVLGLIMVVLGVTTLITVFGVREEPLKEKPPDGVGEPILRLVVMTAIFVLATLAGAGIVRYSASQLSRSGAGVVLQAVVVGLAGLAGMAGSIYLGVYLGARVGIGRDTLRQTSWIRWAIKLGWLRWIIQESLPQQTSFIWWVINRLLFLAAIVSIQGFAQYYLSDVLGIQNAATMTTVLLLVVGVFLIASALGSGYLSDRIGRKRLVGLAALVAAGGTFLLLVAQDLWLVLVAGSIIGLGTGTFLATNWALGTDLAPPQEAGRYLGISNLAGAGAGIVGTGIGGPIADFLNELRPGIGYLVIFALYGVLFLLSAVALTRVKGVG
jgi:MFS family permease